MKRRTLRRLCLAAGLLPALAAAAPAADFVFRNGAVYTVDEERPWAQALAVSGNRIVYVGDEAGAATFIGKKTEVVDLAGGLLLPGFIDSHTHISSAETLDDAPLALRDRPVEETLAVLRDYVAGRPDDRIIRGAGWIVETFPATGPDKKHLDAIVPDRPAVLEAIDAHHLWLNSKALEIAGITQDTPDPDPGKSWFQRYPGSREPTGFIVESPAMQQVQDALARQGYAADTNARFARGLELGFPVLSGAGITALFDAGLNDEAANFATLREFERRGRLPVRIFGSHVHRARITAGDDPVQRFNALRERYHSDLLAARMLKIMIDGTETNHTAYLLEPYADRPDSRGLPFFAPARLDALVRAADAAGIDMHMHVVGDAGARIGLDAVERAIAANPARDRRHALSHLILVHPDDIPRFRELGVIWQSAPGWAMLNPRHEVVRKAVGEARFAERVYPFRAAVDQGVVVTFGADTSSLATGNRYQPLQHIQVGLTRLNVGKPDYPIMPRADQRLPLAELIRGYTINSAYMLRMEDKIGSLRVGKRADLVVLEKNLFEVAPADIHAVRVRLTLMDGKVTHRMAADTPPGPTP